MKQAAKTLIYLKEVGIDSYDELVKKSAVASSDFNGRVKRINEISRRQEEITELQKQIGTYGKTRDIYNQYIKSGRNERFYEEHRADIVLCQAARNYFDKLGYSKNNPLPSINSNKSGRSSTLKRKICITATVNSKTSAWIYSPQKTIANAYSASTGKLQRNSQSEDAILSQDKLEITFAGGQTADAKTNEVRLGGFRSKTLRVCFAGFGAAASTSIFSISAFSLNGKNRGGYIPTPCLPLTFSPISSF